MACEEQTKGGWTVEEDALLASLQAKHGNKWSVVAALMVGRTGQQCAQRWRHKVNPDIKKEKWTPDEDRRLGELYDQFGPKWADIARHMDGRTDQQCMGRWRRHLDPTVKKESWSPEEDKELQRLRLSLGSAWATISTHIVGRTAQQCRARWFQLKSHKTTTARNPASTKAKSKPLQQKISRAPARAQPPQGHPPPQPLVHEQTMFMQGVPCYMQQKFPPAAAPLEHAPLGMFAPPEHHISPASPWPVDGPMHVPRDQGLIQHTPTATNSIKSESAATAGGAPNCTPTGARRDSLATLESECRAWGRELCELPQQNSPITPGLLGDHGLFQGGFTPLLFDAQRHSFGNAKVELELLNATPPPSTGKLVAFPSSIFAGTTPLARVSDIYDAEPKPKRLRPDPFGKENLDTSAEHLKNARNRLHSLLDGAVTDLNSEPN
mmetsp:Transcript_6633/g.24617  ORF Transcript_6633/g.24617 Transcript_6633/m.24617 type:complete len:437 (+) Transcript_6633:145-1455(+)